MTKATEVIQHMVDELNDSGLSSMDGIYASLYFPIHQQDIDVELTAPARMDVKEALSISKDLKDGARACFTQKKGEVISRAYTRRGSSLDVHITCGTVDMSVELSQIMAETRFHLNKYATDAGFTPGIHYYNILDAYLPWEVVRTVDQVEEGWN